MANAKYFHPKSSFYQLKPKPDDRPITVFSTRDLGLPELMVMLQGVTNSAIIFQRVFRHIFQIMCSNVALHIDDAYIFVSYWKK